MKRILFFSLILSFGLVGFAQKRGSLVTKEQKQVVRTAIYNGADISDLGNLEQGNNSTVANTPNKEGFKIVGLTDYDYQSNSSLSGRIYVFDDGTIASTYTLGPAGTGAAFPGRGTGYNYFDGSSWGPIPTERIETYRSGWPQIAPYGENGEIVVSHFSDGGLAGLALNTRPTKGTGEWTQTTFEGPEGEFGETAVFPRVVTAGENNMTIHMTYGFNHAEGETYEGLRDPVFYNRSLDGGVTWDIKDLILEGMTSEEYLRLGADDITWAEPKGETLAFAFTNTFDSDLVVMKSDNNGEDWDKIVVWEHPYPFWDWDTSVTTDSLWAPDGGASVALDAEGKVHLIATLCRVGVFEAGSGEYSFWPYGEGVVYWNEDRPPFEADDPHDALNAWDPEILVPDVNLIGWGQDMDGDGEFTIFNAPEGFHTYRFTIGANTMPTIACGENAQIAIAWAGIAEVDVWEDTYNFRRIWSRQSYDNGESWTEHRNLTNEITQTFDECTFPNIATTINDEFHLLYQADYFVGTALDEDHEWGENRITYFSDLAVGIGDQVAAQSQISVSQNYPNPATTTTRINVELVSGSDLSLEVSNVVGQVVYAENRGTVNGIQNSFVIDVADFTPGVYFFTVKVNEESVTQKMIVE